MKPIGHKAKICILITATRSNIEGFLKCLHRLNYRPEETELVVYIDTDNPAVQNKYNTLNLPFMRKTIRISGNPAPTEVRINIRRNRIADAHNKIRELINADYILGLEDDTLFPADTLERLLPLIQRAETGIAEGVQCGRWGYKIIGAWKVNDIENPTDIVSMPFLNVGKNKFYEKIDAGGFYCYMTKAALFKGTTFEWHDECFGPDVCYGLSLRKQGFINYIDWGLICGHDDFGKVIYPLDGTDQVRYNKINNKWTIKEKI